MNRKPIKLVISPETFETIFMDDTARGRSSTDAPDCPLVIAAGYTRENVRKCDCSNELRIYALASAHGHQCGEEDKCPVRTHIARQ